MVDNAFFDESTEQSQIKARIVANYFWAWANVVKGFAKRAAGRIAYVDLFSGPGRYRDGTKSTPLLVLEKAIRDSDMRQMLVTSFNDANPANAKNLQVEISKLNGIGSLKYQPRVSTSEVGEEIVTLLSKVRLVPTLFFIDPWGYKGLSMELLGSSLRNWGCDCLFFFNYNRINPGLENEAVRVHMDALFGKSRADDLRMKLETLNPKKREAAIIEELAQALGEVGGKFVLPFTFKTASGERTSHHLFLVTKDFLGYKIMKEIMATESSGTTQGVPSFQYFPAGLEQPLLFELQRPLDDLEELLSRAYGGRTLSLKQIFEDHSVGRPYVERNYKDVLIRMEKDGKISTDPPAAKRRTRNGEVTFSERVRVTFTTAAN